LEAKRFIGKGGLDSFMGGIGNDTLDGGDAADTLVGEPARIDTEWSAVQTL
jgi:Ca2+-binding RTX toxin-like protein